MVASTVLDVQVGKASRVPDKERLQSSQRDYASLPSPVLHFHDACRLAASTYPSPFCHDGAL